MELWVPVLSSVWSGKENSCPWGSSDFGLPVASTLGGFACVFSEQPVLRGQWGREGFKAGVWDWVQWKM